MGRLNSALRSSMPVTSRMHSEKWALDSCAFETMQPSYSAWPTKSQHGPQLRWTSSGSIAATNGSGSSKNPLGTRLSAITEGQGGLATEVADKRSCAMDCSSLTSPGPGCQVRARLACWSPARGDAARPRTIAVHRAICNEAPQPQQLLTETLSRSGVLRGQACFDAFELPYCPEVRRGSTTACYVLRRFRAFSKEVNDHPP